MRYRRVLAGWLSGIGGAFVLALLSRSGWRPPGTEAGVLRLTLSARPERIETCRRLSETELAERPAHMRLAMECDGRSATYRLRVWHGQVQLDDRVLHGGGLRRDRPIHLLQEYPLPPGEQPVRIEIRRIEQVPADTARSDVERTGIDRRSRETAERQRRRLEALPPAVELSRTVTVRARAVNLVTWDAVSRELRIGSD